MSLIDKPSRSCIRRTTDCVHREFENRPETGGWLGIWDELRNWIVTAA